MIKQIISDLDGTLLNSKHVLDESDSNLLKALQAMGIGFVVATGRSYDSAQSVVARHGLACDYIVLNGAAIFDAKGNLLDETPFSKEQLCAIITPLLAHDKKFFMYGNNGTSSFDGKGVCELCLQMLLKHGLTQEEADRLIEEGKFYRIDEEYSNIQEVLNSDAHIYKIELFMENVQERMAVEEMLGKIAGITMTTSGFDNIEITSAKAQKGITVEKYCQTREIQKDEVLIFGDSLNDLSMFERFPYCIAMENACEAIKDVSRYETSSNIDHGVAKVLAEVKAANGKIDILKNFQKTKK